MDMIKWGVVFYYLYLTLIKKKSNCVRNFLILFHRVNSSYARVLPSYHVYLLSRLVVLVSEKLSSIFRKPGWKKISNIWFPHPGLHLARMTEWRLGLPCLLRLSGLVFTFVLVLTFCSVQHTFVFHFIASSLTIVFVSALNCLHTLV